MMSYNEIRSKEDVKDVNSWLAYANNRHDERLTNLNIDYLREFNEIKEEFSKIIMMLYFILADLKVTTVGTMFRSAMKQKDFIVVVRKTIKKYRIDKEFRPIFDQEIKMLRKRLVHIKKICMEIFHTTEYGPFFEQVGIDSLSIPELPSSSDVEVLKANKALLLAPMGDVIRAWNAEHQDIVAAHLEAVKPEVERYHDFKAKLATNAKAEKEKRQKEAKALKAEMKEREKEQKKRKQKRNNVDRSFDVYFDPNSYYGKYIRGQDVAK